jgi:hypothetical protein
MLLLRNYLFSLSCKSKVILFFEPFNVAEILKQVGPWTIQITSKLKE